MPSAESQFFMELRHVGGVGLFILVLVLKNNRFLFGLLCQAAKTRRLVAINRSEIKLSPATTMTSFQNVQNITVSNGVQPLVSSRSQISKILEDSWSTGMNRYDTVLRFLTVSLRMFNMFTHVSLPHVVLYTSVTTVADSCEWHRKCALGSHRVSVPGMCGGTLRATFDPFQSFHSDWIWACQQHS